MAKNSYQTANADKVIKTTTRTQGVKQEDSVNLEKKDNKHVRKRSLTLLKELIRPVKWLILLNLILILVAQICNAILPSFVAFGVDQGFPAAQNADMSKVTIAAITLTLSVLAYIVLSYLNIRLTSYISQKVLYSLRLRIFQHTQKLSMGFHKEYTSGRVIARQTSDLDSVSELFKSGLEQILSQVLFLLLTLIIVFIIDPLSGLIISLALIPTILVISWYQKKSQIAYRAASVVSAKFITRFIEAINGNNTIKSFRKEKENSRINAELAANTQQTTLRSIGLVGVLGPALMFIGGIASGAILFAGGVRVLNGSLQLGILIALIMYASRFFRPIMELAMFHTSFQAATAGLEKISGLLEEEPTINDPAHDTTDEAVGQTGKIEFKNVSFSYADNEPILKNINLTIPSGQSVAIVGKTGSGKSTLAKLLSRFYDVSEGEITIDGYNIKDIPDKKLRNNVTLITQEPFLFSGTVKENIAYGNPEASDKDIKQAAHAAGADKFINKLPEGYDTNVNRQGERLSAGERQLISFSRAFLADPSILILDEATSSLDLPNEEMIQESLSRLLGERKSIIIAHRLTTVLGSDRILVVDEGQIVEDGSPEKLINTENGVFAKLYQSWLSTI